MTDPRAIALRYGHGRLECALPACAELLTVREPAHCLNRASFQAGLHRLLPSALPPGPIANPGRESLKAALTPAQSAYLYFVARPDGSGRHSFSQDFEAHQRAVRQYRRGIEKRNEAVTTRTVDTRKRARKNR